MEPRKVRLLRLALLQIAILSIANGCRHGARTDGPPAQPAPRHRYTEARFIPENLEHTATSRLDTGRLVEVPK